jgi:hypothetical protein
MASQTELPHAAELTRPTDQTRETKAKESPKDLPNVNRLKVLSEVNLLPAGQPTASLHDFYLGGAKEGQQVADTGRIVAKTEPVRTEPAQIAARTDLAPPAEKVSADSAMKTLQSPDATAQQKIEAVSKLYDTMPKDGKGHVHITLKDGDKDKQFEISKEKLGHGVSLTHLNYRDEKGHYHPVLRGVERHGHIDQEQDKHGSKADFKGDWWSKHAGDSGISKFAQSTDAPLPPYRPSHLGQPDKENSDRPAPLPPHRPSHLGQPDKENSDRPAPLPPHRPSHLGQPDAENSDRPAPLPPHRPHRQGEAPEPEVGPERKTEPQRKPAPEREERSDLHDGKFVKPSDLHNFWVVQPSKFECGSSAEAMAISKVTGRAPFSAGEIRHLSNENGTMGAGAFPHGPGNRNMEEQLKRHGVHAVTHDFAGNPHGEMNKLDEELTKGNHAVAYIRNPATGHGHFVFIDGKTEDGRYVVGNSGRHTFGNAPPVSRRELESWMLGEKRGSPYFVSVSPTSQIADND